MNHNIVAKTNSIAMKKSKTTKPVTENTTKPAAKNTIKSTNNSTTKKSISKKSISKKSIAKKSITKKLTAIKSSKKLTDKLLENNEIIIDEDKMVADSNNEDEQKLNDNIFSFSF